MNLKKYLNRIGFKRQIFPNIIQPDHFKNYKIEQLDPSNYLLLASLKDSVDFQKKYIFDLQNRAIKEFSDQNHFKQSSSDSYFVKNRLCTLPTKDGRKTIFNDLFKQRTGQETEQRIIKGNANLIEILKKEFKITI